MDGLATGTMVTGPMQLSAGRMVSSVLSTRSKETLLTLFLFHAPNVSSQVEDQGEKAAFMLPLPPLALGPILKALHLGEGVGSTWSCYIRVMGKKKQGGRRSPGG